MDETGVHPPDGTTVLAKLHPSQPRRLLGIAVLGALGLILVRVVAMAEIDPLWRLLLGALAVAVLTQCLPMWRVTRAPMVLTREGLLDGLGRSVARVDEIAAVDAGIFAFKPSNGFALRLGTPGPAGWAPGLWWRVGRRVGVGGLVSPSEAKAMAEILRVLVAERETTAAG